MRYVPPAVEARFELSAQLAYGSPSEVRQPVWRPSKPDKPKEG